MAYEKVVLSVSDEDIRGYVDKRTWESLVAADAVDDAVDIAANHMQKYLDQVDFFEDMCREGADTALRLRNSY